MGAKVNGMGTAQKTVDVTKHAAERMCQRGVTQNDVEATIRNPDTHSPGKSAYTERFERDFPPAKRLVVIAEKLAEDNFRIVTTYWV
jgi:hypothetical protein